MNENVEFAQEMILKALLDKMNDNADLLSLLLMSAETVEDGLKGIKEGIGSIKKDTEQINSKLDIVLQKLDDLESSFNDLKAETREVDQKLVLMASKLDKMEKSLNDEELEDYYALCQGLYDNWDELEDLTRRLIPVAEYLYSKLQKYDKPDYSPVILELCRAIENEFLLKIFIRYTNDIVRRQGRGLDSFLTVDRASSFLKEKTGMFVKAINKCARGGRPDYTLGQMNTILSVMNEQGTVSQSPLLQDFQDYLRTETVMKDLLNARYVQKINDLVDQYRNPSAHPGYMPLDKAKKCKEIMPDRLDYLMRCVCIG